MLRSFFQAWRASRSFGHALRLERSGDLLAAFEVASDGLSRLRQPRIDRTSPHTLSVFISITALLDRLGPRVQREQVAQAAMREAIDLWKSAIVAEPALERAETPKKYIASFQRRLDEPGLSEPS